MKYLISTILLNCILLTGFSQAQNKELVYHIRHSLDNCDFYEVTEEMFKTISEDERYQKEAKINYFKKINYLIYVECEDPKSNFYDEFMPFNKSGFNVLMRSKTSDERFTFYRKKDGDLFEYLLVHDGGLSYIITSLNISTIQELSGIMNMVGELGT